MADGEIKVEMRLGTAKLAADTQKASSIINQGVKTNIPSSLTSKSSAQMMQEWRDQNAAIVRAQNAAFRARQYAGPTPPTIPAAGGGMKGFSPSALSATGIPYISTLARAMMTPITAALAAIAIEVMMVIKSLQAMRAAIEHARALYAKQLQSGGLPGGFVAQRAGMAEVLGVGEREVFQYAAAINYLNQRLAQSSSIFAKTTPELAATAWEFKILAVNLQALFAALVTPIAPEIREFTAGLNELVKGVQNVAMQFPDIMRAMLQAVRVAILGVGGSQLWNYIMRMGIASGATAAPTAAASAHRYQNSPWERMGLVIGSSTGSNYARDTATNTKETVKSLKELNRKMALPRGSGLVDSGIVPSAP